MWQKIKNFFNKTIVQVAEVIVMILCAIGLMVGGWQGEDFHSLVDYTGSAITAILAVTKFIKTIMHRVGGD